MSEKLFDVTYNNEGNKAFMRNNIVHFNIILSEMLCKLIEESKLNSKFLVKVDNNHNFFETKNNFFFLVGNTNQFSYLSTDSYVQTISVSYANIAKYFKKYSFGRTTDISFLNNILFSEALLVLHKFAYSVYNIRDKVKINEVREKYFDFAYFAWVPDKDLGHLATWPGQKLPVQYEEIGFSSLQFPPFVLEA